MPNFTENYNLKKPLQEEFYNIDDHNGNMDIIDEELKNRARLDENGKVLEEQLPSMDYVPTSEKGKANGVATLGGDGKVPKEQLPESASGGGSGKRTVRFTVGSSQYGWTASDCDYLCDGTADDVEINAAIQALRSTGGEIVLLDGLYNLASAILINKDGVTLTGNGANTKIIRAFNDDENDETLQGLFIVTGTYCAIKNLYIDDVKGNYTAYRAISLYGGTNCIIADNTIVNIGGDGIYVNSDNNTIDNNNVSSSGNSGINLNKTNKSIVTNNKVSGSDMYGIFAIRVGDGVINNNVCTGNYNSGISLYWADRTTITGNASNNNGDCGFYITRGSGNIICGNTFVGNGAYGVTIQIYASNTVVMSNNFKDNASGDVNNKGENNTIHLPHHTHDGADIVSGFETLRLNIGAARIATGSYKGTGSYGSSNPNSITFDFTPKMIFINSVYKPIQGVTPLTFAFFNCLALTSEYVEGAGIILTGESAAAGTNLVAKMASNTVSWYSATSGTRQLNSSVMTYHWIAIG